MIKLQRTVHGDCCLGAARCVPSATIPAANQAAQPQQTVQQWSKEQGLPGGKGRGRGKTEATGGREKTAD